MIICMAYFIFLNAWYFAKSGNVRRNLLGVEAKSMRIIGGA
jgi:hypothetical protein